MESRHESVTMLCTRPASATTWKAIDRGDTWRLLALNWTQEPSRPHARVWTDRFQSERNDGQTRHSGTRITVELILEKFAAGYSEGEILRAYPHITREGIRTALAFAAEALQASELYPLERAAS